MVPKSKPVSYSQTWTFFEGEWHEGNVPIAGPRTHGLWLGSAVFDGARAFEGVAPDLDRHCARVNRSAVNFGLKPIVDLDAWLGLAREGIARFGAKAELYIRPMYWPQHGAGGGVLFDPETTNWCISIYEAPMPQPTGNAITISPFRRPTMDRAPCAKRPPEASTTASCWICSAMSPSPATPMCSWPGTALFIRLCRTAPS